MNANLAIQAIEAMEPYARRFMEQYERETPGWQKQWFLSWQQANLILAAYDDGPAEDLAVVVGAGTSACSPKGD